MINTDFAVHKMQTANFRLMFLMGYLAEDEFIARLETIGYDFFQATAELMDLLEAEETHIGKAA